MDWNQLRCSSTRNSLNKLWSEHKMEYYTALKRNEKILKELIWKVLQHKMLRGKSKVYQEHC